MWIQPSPGYPLGSDWGHHFSVAEFIWHPDPDISYPLFRRPWYGWLLGALGEGMGYLEAAQLLGKLSAVLIVLAAGIGAWALAGPLAAPVAAFIAAGMPLVREGGLWVNHYPLLGAACGLALAAGAAASRWPRLPWVVLAGLAAGAAAAIDVRGEMVLGAVLALVVLGLPWASDWRKTGLLGLCLVVSAAAVPAHAVWLDRAFDIPELNFDEQLRVQRAGVLGQIQGGTFQDAGLEAACDGVEVVPLQLDGVRSSCAAALRSSSFVRMADQAMLPPPALLWLLPLALLPLGRRRLVRFRSSVAAGVVFGLPTAALWIGMGWVTYFPRYVLPFAAVLAMLLPVAVHRLLRVGGLGPRWLGAIAAVGALGLAIEEWPGHPQPEEAAQIVGAGVDRAAGHYARWAHTELGEADSIVDCAGLALDSLLLPQRIDYLRYPPGDEACVEHIRAPRSGPGQRYLITMHQNLPEHVVADAHSRSSIAALGWALVDTDGPADYELWRHGGSR